MRVGSPAVQVTELPAYMPNRWCDACPGSGDAERIYKLHVKAGDLYIDRTSKVCRNHLYDLLDAIEEVLDIERPRVERS
jgi:hypothetical protein